MSLEQNIKPELYERPNINRKDGTHPSLALAALIEKEVQATKPNSGPALIEHENIIRKWAPNSESKKFGSQLCLQLLGRIEALCRCRIEQAYGSADFLVKADREQYIEMGISKLKKVNKMIVSLLSLPIRFRPELIDSTMAQPSI